MAYLNLLTIVSIFNLRDIVLGHNFFSAFYFVSALYFSLPSRKVLFLVLPFNILGMTYNIINEEKVDAILFVQTNSFKNDMIPKD